MFEQFRDTAIKAIMLSQEEARRTGHNLVGTEQVLLGLIGEGTGIAAVVLREMNVTLKKARQQVNDLVGRGPGYVPANIPFTPKAKAVFEQAFSEARQLGNNYVGTEHLLLAIAREEKSIAAKILQRLGVDRDELRNQVIRRAGEAEATATAAAPVGGQKEGFFGFPQMRKPKLAEFSINLSDRAAEGKLDPIVGREKEIDRVIQILGRRTKSNPVLVGEPGVGKTAIASGLAQRIHAGDVPENLQEKQVIELDMGLLVAGTRFRGEFEERLKAIVEEVKKSGKIILVIDEIHTLVGAGGIEGGVDAANLLKPALARGELQCLGATTLDEYRKHIERDTALERRFQRVMVNEPSVTDTIDILMGLRSCYEEFHNVIFTNEAIEAAALLSDRYISDRFLPDKAIDLIDEAGSRSHLRDDLRRKTEGIKSAENQPPCVVDEEEIAHIVASWTNIPVTKLTEVESERLLHLEQALHEQVIGQNEAVTAVSRAIRRARVGMKDPNRPIASFIFSGPTGVGKTELAKALTTYLFGSEDAMIRVDMSEFMESHTTAKLIGSPPGYIGFDEGGQLTEAVRRRPYSVILFDEIEKAHPDVFNLLLQLLDDGRLTDAQGRTVDFKNTLVIMTSNIGSKIIEKGGGGIGFETAEDYGQAQYNRLCDRVNDELKNYFRPEFLNRLDEIIVFRQLTQNEIVEIAELILQDVRDRLYEQRNIQLEVSKTFKDLVAKVGYDPSYGARPLRRAVMNLLEDPLADAILSGKVKDNQQAWIDVDDDGKVIVEASHQYQLQPVG
ncbi:MAG: ATP-dependent Clp protease ATP-binding subunit [Jaaginema sp. PMC 1079.18]|nr:ATP-dependent Clp protease ATP-binding subunit [Jaaginema sp. PMC 1080.18]MEC4850228.1 ATP-dependent Clp protease ATP-binding subunit [Jaaginema sp. PMC 1079.18]MEC4865887.1 ATP-dependent Clp protease ATP-binding subunit [Jaaginema sp. PMC 1078.18]